jgi:hypothetical protein
MILPILMITLECSIAHTANGVREQVLMMGNDNIRMGFQISKRGMHVEVVSTDGPIFCLVSLWLSSCFLEVSRTVDGVPHIHCVRLAKGFVLVCNGHQNLSEKMQSCFIKTK